MSKGTSGGNCEFGKNQSSHPEKLITNIMESANIIDLFRVFGMRTIPEFVEFLVVQPFDRQ